MRLDFQCRNQLGVISAEVVANSRPLSFGGDEAENLGFPVCTASVAYDGDGYAAMFGWVQLVRSTDAGPDFEKDPFLLFPAVEHPYPFYGYKPTLFDAPGRAHRNDMDWLAHTFLAMTPIEPDARLVKPLQGFSWGFTIRDGGVILSAIRPLAARAWVRHLPYLEETYPDWRFDPLPSWTSPDSN
jgi:hypothetical protein